jgi:hypothetical protein
MLLLYLVVLKPFLLFTNVWKSILCLYHMFTCVKIWALHTLVCQSSSASWQMKEGKLLFNWPTPCSIVLLEKLIFPQSKIPHILCNLKVSFCVHKSTPLAPILNRRIQFVPHHISKIHFVFLPSVPRSSKCYIVLVSSFLYCMLPVNKEVSVLNRIGFCSYSLALDSKADQR